MEKNMANRTNESTSFAKRLLSKNVATLSTSQSTPSFPDLILSSIKKQNLDFSTEMRRGYSEHNSQQTTVKEPKQQM